MKVKEIRKDILVIDDVLVSEECEHLIEKSEKLGYEEATINTDKGSKLVKGIRNNERVLFKDEKFATEIWGRVRDFVPQQIGKSIAIGLNELFRVYKYGPGQRFRKHIDESYIRNDREASYYTFMIYLNDGYEGGETSFDLTAIKGNKGMALIFLHSLLHEGEKVSSGIKYVLRTDIMYRLLDD